MTASRAAAEAEPDLIVRREGAAGVIRLNRPKAINAMTLDMSLGIDVALDRFEADPAVALILLEGAGDRGLCAGGESISSMCPKSMPDRKPETSSASQVSRPVSGRPRSSACSTRVLPPAACSASASRRAAAISSALVAGSIHVLWQ